MIEAVSPGVGNLSDEELEAIQCFTLMWTLFEAQVLENHVSVSKISEVVERIETNQFEEDWFKEQLDYFANRYVEDGTTNYRFEHLHLRNNDNPELVRSVLIGEIVSKPRQLIACLIIIYRFRNNFFHGLKWAYGLREQLDNFSQSSALLSEFMRRFRNEI